MAFTAIPPPKNADRTALKEIYAEQHLIAAGFLPAVVQLLIGAVHGHHNNFQSWATELKKY